MKIQNYLLQSLLLSVVLLSTVKISLAEPSSTVIYLMKEPVSLIDFGLYKMEEGLKVIRGGEPFVSTDVSYNIETNRIRIWVFNVSVIWMIVSTRHLKVDITRIRPFRKGHIVGVYPEYFPLGVVK